MRQPRQGTLRRHAILALAGALSASGVAAQTPAPPPGEQHAKTYAACMELARSVPDNGIAFAREWERGGGDEAARHCGAVALLNSGAYREAAERLGSLAATMRTPNPALQAELLAQAGQAWLIAGDPVRALAAQDRALALAKDDINLHIDRAITRASLERYWDAIDDLNRALDLDPGRTEALVFRATAWRKLRNADLAMDDLERALKHAPQHVDALLERGIVQAMRNDFAAARADWKRVLEIDAESPAGQAARDNLKRLEARRP